MPPTADVGEPLGTPYVDLDCVTVTSSERGPRVRPMGRSPVTAAPGFAARSDLVARYADRSGANVDSLAW